MDEGGVGQISQKTDRGFALTAMVYSALLVLWGTTSTFVTMGDSLTLVEYAPIAGSLLLLLPLVVSIVLWRIDPSRRGHWLAVIACVATWIWVATALPAYGLGLIWFPLAVAYTGVAVRTSKRNLERSPPAPPDRDSPPAPK